MLSRLTTFVLLANMLFAGGYYSKRVDINEGLSQPSVTCIQSDSHGAVWIGTRFGLNKYRSNRISVFGGEYVHSMFLDSEDCLWIGTEGGLYRKAAGDDELVLVSQKTIVYCAAEKEGRIYFGGAEGIHCYDRLTGTFTRRFLSMENAYVVRILEQPDGSFLVVDRGLGLFVLSSGSASLKKVQVPSLDFTIIMDACFYEGSLYVAAYSKGLYAIDLESGETLREYNSSNSGLSFDVILSLREIDHQLWLGTDGGGICILDRGEINPLSDISGAGAGLLLDGSVTCLFNDEGGTIWAGSVRNGAFSLKTADIRHFSLETSVVNSIWKGRDGLVWIGTDGGGVNLFNPATGSVSGYPGSQGLKIHSLTELDDDRLLLSVYSKGLQVFDKVSGRRTPFIIIDQAVNALECGSGGSPRLYATDEGDILIMAIRAFLYNPSSGRFSRFRVVPEGLDVSELTVFGKDADRGFYYAFSTAGVFRINVRQMEIERIFSFDGSETVNTCAISSEGVIWVGTSTGLKYFRRGESALSALQTYQFSRVTQLKSGTDGRLWIAADNLLFSMDRAGNIEIMDESDGFPANEVMASTFSNEAGDEAVYLGGTGGFVEILKSATFRENPHLELELYEVTAGDGPVSCETGGRIRIPWKYGSLYVGVNLRGIDPYQKELYRFELRGAGTPHVTESYEDVLPLPGLTEGTYQINASYLQRDGSWSPTVHMLDIVVTPPWYRSRWFFFLVTLAALAALAFFVERYNRNKQKTLATTLSRWVATTVDYQDMPREETLQPRETDLLKKINRYIEENIADPNLNVSAIASEAAMSRATLYSKLKSITGMGVAQYVEDLRIRRACHLLKETPLSVAEISEQVGFSTPNYFSMRFKQAVGISPLTFRKNSM